MRHTILHRRQQAKIQAYVQKANLDYRMLSKILIQLNNSVIALKQVLNHTFYSLSEIPITVYM